MGLAWLTACPNGDKNELRLDQVVMLLNSHTRHGAKESQPPKKKTKKKNNNNQKTTKNKNHLSFAATKMFTVGLVYFQLEDGVFRVAYLSSEMPICPPRRGGTIFIYLFIYLFLFFLGGRGPNVFHPRFYHVSSRGLPHSVATE